MATTNERIDDLKNVVDGIDSRVKDLENKVSQTREEALANNLEQYKMITQAVAEGNKPILEQLANLDKRIVIIENAEANKALEEKKDKRKFIRDVVIAGIVTTTIGLIVLGFLNNYALITSDAIRNN